MEGNKMNLLVGAVLCSFAFVIGLLYQRDVDRKEGYQKIVSSTGSTVICQSENPNEPAVVFYPDGKMKVKAK